VCAHLRCTNWRACSRHVDCTPQSLRFRECTVGVHLYLSTNTNMIYAINILFLHFQCAVDSSGDFRISFVMKALNYKPHIP
jgi:hypothetical protein